MLFLNENDKNINFNILKYLITLSRLFFFFFFSFFQACPSHHKCRYQYLDGEWGTGIGVTLEHFPCPSHSGHFDPNLVPNCGFVNPSKEYLIKFELFSSPKVSNYDMNLIQSWLSANKLTLNVKKTKYMLIGSQFKLFQIN